MVLLPEPLSPVNQTVAPFCFSRPPRSSRVTWPSCQVMFVALLSLILRNSYARPHGSRAAAKQVRTDQTIVLSLVVRFFQPGATKKPPGRLLVGAKAVASPPSSR